MDTITHGIAGALIANAIFRGEDMFGSRPGKVAAKEKHGTEDPTQREKHGTKDPTQREKRGSKDPPLQRSMRGRVVTWSLMLGAIFPDSDVLRDMFSHDKLLIVTWHRSITHSLILLRCGHCCWHGSDYPSVNG